MSRFSIVAVDSTLPEVDVDDVDDVTVSSVSLPLDLFVVGGWVGVIVAFTLLVG